MRLLRKLTQFPTKIIVQEHTRTNTVEQTTWTTSVDSHNAYSSFCLAFLFPHLPFSSSLCSFPLFLPLPLLDFQPPPSCCFRLFVFLIFFFLFFFLFVLPCSFVSPGRENYCFTRQSLVI